jgi:hypothetical protein
MKYIPKIPKLVGPSITKSNSYVYERMCETCTECECCGEQWHFKAVARHGVAIQVNVGGQVMAARKAMYMATFPNKPIQNGRRITSRCKNQNCINPKLLIQSTASDLLKTHYTKGIRDRRVATVHLVAQRLKNTKLSADDVIRIVNDDRKGKAASHEYGISKEHYNAIQRGDARKASNPFAGLMRYRGKV